MPHVQVYVENRVLKVVEIDEGHAIMLGRKMYKDNNIEMMREMDINCGVQIFNEKGVLQFENFGSVRAESKMNDPAFVPEPAPYDEFINTYKHEMIEY